MLVRVCKRSLSGNRSVSHRPVHMLRALILPTSWNWRRRRSRWTVPRSRTRCPTSSVRLPRQWQGTYWMDFEILDKIGSGTNMIEFVDHSLSFHSSRPGCEIGHSVGGILVMVDDLCFYPGCRECQRRFSVFRRDSFINGILSVVRFFIEYCVQFLDQHRRI